MLNKKMMAMYLSTNPIIDCLALNKKFTTLYKVIGITLYNIIQTVLNIRLVLIAIAITLLNSASFAQNGPPKLFIVCIDPGHGGSQPGTSGKYTKEKDITLKVAMKLGKTIEQNSSDIKVIYTRTTDKTLGLKERAQVANNNHADLFISIHANSLPEDVPEARKQSIYGTETYVLGLGRSKESLDVAMRENSVILLEENYEEKYEGFDPTSPESYILFSLTQSVNHASSIRLASLIENQFSTRAGRRSLGVKQNIFQVLWETAMPAVLVEIGYLSNTKEEKELNDPLVQDYIASAIFRAIRDYKDEIESKK
jgi:N-acetylmuramoyl-L-alanine amidase